MVLIELCHTETQIYFVLCINSLAELKWSKIKRINGRKIWNELDLRWINCVSNGDPTTVTRLTPVTSCSITSKQYNYAVCTLGLPCCLILEDVLVSNASTETHRAAGVRRKAGDRPTKPRCSRTRVHRFPGSRLRSPRGRHHWNWCPGPNEIPDSPRAAPSGTRRYRSPLGGRRGRLGRRIAHRLAHPCRPNETLAKKERRKKVRRFHVDTVTCHTFEK